MKIIAINGSPRGKKQSSLTNLKLINNKFAIFYKYVIIMQFIL